MPENSPPLSIHQADIDVINESTDAKTADAEAAKAFSGQFVAATGASYDIARQYLSIADQDIENAIELYLTLDGADLHTEALEWSLENYKAGFEKKNLQIQIDDLESTSLSSSVNGVESGQNTEEALHKIESAREAREPPADGTAAEIHSKRRRVPWQGFLEEIFKDDYDPDQGLLNDMKQTLRLPKGMWNDLLNEPLEDSTISSSDHIGRAAELEEFLSLANHEPLDMNFYRPLQHYEEPYIRLVELLPGTEFDEIQCQLIYSPLERCSPYEALSYCWGDPDERSPISCDGVRFSVTRNLKSAMLHLRYKDTKRILWIDAICINQEDLEEREQQVQMMRDIYKGASRTVIWLGEAASDSEIAFPAMRRMKDIIDSSGEELDMQDMYRKFLASLGGSVFKEYKTGATKNGPTEIELLAIYSILGRPWWQRSWVAQEIGVAEEAILVCSLDEISWDDFSIATGVCFLTQSLKVFRTVSRSGGHFAVYERFLGFNALRGKRPDPTILEDRFGLLSLLNDFRELHATDPRDKVYAVFGLTSTDIASIGLVPTYVASVEDVYKTVAIAVLEYTQNLDLLSTPRARSELSKTLPSWVPDWSDTRHHAASLLRRQNEAKGFIDPAPQFLSSKGTRMSLENLHRGTMLRLEGHAVDKIKDLTSVFSARAEFDPLPPNPSVGYTFRRLGKAISISSFFWERLSEWESMAISRAYKTYPTGEDAKSVYWRTLYTNHTPQGPEQAAEDFDRLRKLYTLAKKLHRMGAHKVRSFWTPSVVLAATLSENLGEGREKFLGMAEHVRERRLMRTERGYLGLVPGDAKVGDSVALFKGGNRPFVLRERGVAWELVGDCYVHGIMYGEAFVEALCEDWFIV